MGNKNPSSKTSTKIFSTISIYLGASILTSVPGATLAGIDEDNLMDGKRPILISYPADREEELQRVLADFNCRRLKVDLYSYNSNMIRLKEALLGQRGAMGTMEISTGRKSKGNPQLENGYTRITNELLEALIRTKLSGQELRIILLIIRKTYGFHKKEDCISLTQMAKMLGVRTKQSCSRTVLSLEKRGILRVNQNVDSLVKMYRFNKHFHEWKGVNQMVDGVNQMVKEGSTKRFTHIITKETIQKKVVQNAHFAQIWPEYPNKVNRSRAEKAFLKTVRAPQDLKDVRTALSNYKSHLAKETWKKPQNGSTFFNNWRDWLESEPEKKRQVII